MAFLLVRDTVFSLLPTTCPAPMNSAYGPIHYYSPVIADRQAHRGYVHGIDKDNRHYVLCVEYDQTPAPLTLYYTDPLPEAGFPEIVLTADGDLMIVGGLTYNKVLGGQLDNDNFSPLSTVFLLHIGGGGVATPPVGTTAAWPWIAVVLAVLATAIGVLLVRKRRKPQPPVTEETAPADVSATNQNEDLMRRICNMMEQQQLYLNSDLKLADLATMLATNRNAVSSCINSQRGCSFSQFVNEYRVRHAQELMQQQADMKITEVWMQSGFSTETSFFRSFKTVTGMTPSEWKKAQAGGL